MTREEEGTSARRPVDGEEVVSGSHVVARVRGGVGISRHGGERGARGMWWHVGKLNMGI